MAMPTAAMLQMVAYMVMDTNAGLSTTKVESDGGLPPVE